jgi:hypothetical protein
MMISKINLVFGTMYYLSNKRKLIVPEQSAPGGHSLQLIESSFVE